MGTKLLYLFGVTLMLSSSLSNAQVPSNDNCDSAHIITISGSGYGLGTFRSDTVDLTNATVQSGENFNSTTYNAGQTAKTVWYKFTINTARACSLFVKQPTSLIPSGIVGFSVYKTNSCFPVGTLADYSLLNSQSQWGFAYHYCLKPGDYLVQVCAKNAANGPIYVELLLSDSTGLSGAAHVPYDLPTDAYDFGVPPSCINSVDLQTGCLTVQNAAESCPALGANYLDYSQSAWFTFTTPAYLDWVGVYVTQSPGPNFNNSTPGSVTGYNLYQGDAKVTPISSLPLIDGCVTDTFDASNYSVYLNRDYECQLLPNTTYSIQLFFHKDFQQDISVYLDQLGVAPTSSTKPLIASVAPSNKLSILPAGNTTATDYWGCNSRLSVNACGQTNPSTGVYCPMNSITYQLNDWYTFELSQSSNVSFSISSPVYGLFGRIFKKDINASCLNIDTAIDLYTQFLSNVSLNCMPAGKYSMQILGNDDNLEAVSGYYPYYPYNACYPKDNLGQLLNVSITVTPVQSYNHYSLTTNGAVDTVNRIGNTYGALKQDTTYTTHTDTFGCENTVMPAGTHCNDPLETKAIYFEFNVGDANADGIPDSGTVYLQGNFSWNYWYGNNVLYKGDANALANAQNRHFFPDSITGLSYATPCFGNNYCVQTRACVTPGMYTLVTYGDSTLVSQNVSYSIGEQLVTTAHRNAALAEDMGNVLDSIALYGGGTVTSQTDYFTCIDNPATIGGNAPCALYNGIPATKLIYRQFYLSSPALVTITSASIYTCYNAGVLTLFHGKATNGMGTLTPVGGSWDCFNSNYTGPCTPLQAGWYTIVSYGEGPTYGNPTINYVGSRGNGGDIGLPNFITLIVTQAPPGPIYNRPHKAAVDSITNLPFVIKPAINSGTSAYPVTDTIYTLYTEFYNCTTDTPFASHPVGECNSAYQPNRVTYYVFQLTQIAYIHIGGLNSAMAKLYPFNVRIDSSLMSSVTPLQPCVNNGDYIELCRLQPGTYTLVIFPPDYFAGSSLTPTIYVENIGYSRFDHAVNAYDFGLMPMDSVWYSGKPGDVNPFNPGRAASNDFFYCTTGSQSTDPIETMCLTESNPNIYTGVNNIYAFDDNRPAYWYNVPRRNLWYTFVLDKGGNCRVRINNKTPNKTTQYPAAIYKSDVNGTLPFSTVVSTGQVDSTVSQGLTFLATNLWYSYCGAVNEISLPFRDPCTAIKDRYYIVVDNQYTLEPNSQVEIEILYDTMNIIVPKYDHYSEANVINGLNQTAPPYTNVVLGPGVYTGATDNFTCATYSAPSDQLSCGVGQKTLWYKFAVGQTSLLHLRYLINGAYEYPDGCQASIFRETTPGDSTSVGLLYIGRTDASGPPDSLGNYWNIRCISAGTYYVMFTGYNRLTEDVQPIIWIENQQGDYCTDPVSGTISAAGSINMNAVVDCHTLGEGFGEDGSNMGCLIPSGNNLNQYKTTWFRFDVTGTDTFDITAQVTGTLANQASYRVLFGNCSAMNTDVCSASGGSVNRLDCMVAGSYYVQVVEPVAITGNLTVTVNAALSPPGCNPRASCFVVPNYTTNSPCSTDSVYFINQSTSGDSIKYSWNFGFGGLTDTVRNPVIKFPAPALTQNYSVLLVVTNTSCNKTDSIRHTVTVNKKPRVNLGNDTTVCSPNVLVLRATSEPGTEYLWFDGSTDSLYTATYTGQFSVADTFNGCTVYDTINVTVNPLPLADLGPDITLCGGQIFSANVYQGLGETYLWSNGTTVSTFDTANAGTYWVRVNVGNCIARDTITISTLATAQPLGNDTTICTGNTLTLDATTTGATGYAWDDGSINATRSVNSAGVYWVEIGISGCTISDSITISAPPVINAIIAGTTTICSGVSTTLTASGGTSYVWSNADITASITVSPITTTTYNVTVTDVNTCTASASATVTVTTPPVAAITPASATVCNGTGTTLTASGGTSYLWSNADVTNSISVTPVITTTYDVTVTDVNTCTASASAIVTVASPPVAVIAPAAVTICSGDNTTLTASGGTSYVWSNADVTVAITVSPLSTTTYDVTVTDVNSCTASASSVVTVNSLPVAAIAPNAVSICSGVSTTLTASGGTSYVWSNADITASITVSPITTTTYNVTVTDVNTCTASASAIVSIIQPIILSTVITDVSCYGGIDGAVNLNVTGAQAPINYLWSNTELTQNITNVSAGSYMVTVTDNVGCVDTITATVSQPQQLNIAETHIDVTCYGYTDGSASVTSSGGTPPYNYLWSNGNSSAFVSNLSAGNYSVTVDDQSACTVILNVLINQPTEISLSALITNPTCASNPADGSIILSVTGGTNPYTFLWSNGNNTNTIINVLPGNYFVTVSDANNCLADSSFNVIYQYDFTVDATPSVTINLGDNTTIGFTVSGNIGNYQIIWDPYLSLSCVDCAAPIASPVITTTYQIEVTNDVGCFAIDTVTVSVIPDYSLFIPNAFTPNNDGNNDFFEVFGNKKALYFVSILVFDRWGEKVFESNDINFKWDGVYKGEKLPPCVLVYQLKVSFVDGHSEKIFKGSVTLIR